jgi:hypothetical protein
MPAIENRSKLAFSLLHEAFLDKIPSKSVHFYLKDSFDERAIQLRKQVDGRDRCLSIPRHHPTSRLDF